MASDRHRNPDELSLTSRGAPVILDSNFLFIPLQFGVDVFSELERLLGGLVRCIVLTPVIEELRLLRLDAKPSLKKDIDFALSLTDRCDVIACDLRPGETVDDSILRMAVEIGCPVATNDADLRQRLRTGGIPVVYLRQRAYLDIEGFV